MAGIARGGGELEGARGGKGRAVKLGHPRRVIGRSKDSDKWYLLLPRLVVAKVLLAGGGGGMDSYRVSTHQLEWNA